MKEKVSYYALARPEIASVVPAGIKTILDIGTGEGYFLKLVKEQKGCETWGIEVNTIAVEMAKTHVNHIIPGKVEDVLHLIPDDYFDCITFNDVLEHMVAPHDVLTMMKPKLSKNGIIIASIPNVRYIFNLYELLVKKDWDYKDAGILDSTHLRFFTQKSMKSMIERAGYKLESQTGSNEITSWKFRLFNLVTLGIFSDSRFLQFICIAEKS